MSQLKSYLGDAVYIDTNGGYRVVLTTEDGRSVTNTIYLEPVVLAAMLRWLERYMGPSGTLKNLIEAQRKQAQHEEEMVRSGDAATLKADAMVDEWQRRMGVIGPSWWLRQRIAAELRAAAAAGAVRQ